MGHVDEDDFIDLDPGPLASMRVGVEFFHWTVEGRNG